MGNRFLLGCSVICLTMTFKHNAVENESLRKALTFHASFDQGGDVDFGSGSKQIYTATSYKKREDAQSGLHNPDVSLAPGAGRFGGALKFAKKNTKAVYYSAAKNVAYRPNDW